MNKKILSLLVLLVVLIAAALLAASLLDSAPDQGSVGTFEECAQIPGAKMLLTYPEQCVTADGRTFVNPQQTQ